MQNKAKLMDDQMNVTPLLINYYENLLTFFRPKNKAKQTQNKAKFKNAIKNVTALLTKGYENLRPFSRRKNKAKQSQFKPNFSPKLALFSQYWLCNSPTMTKFGWLQVRIHRVVSKRCRSGWLTAWICTAVLQGRRKV